MRILMLVFNQTNKGTFWRAWNFGRMITEWGHHVTLVSTSPRNLWQKERKILDGVNVVEMPDLLPGSLRSGWGIWNTIHRMGWLNGKDFDIVHAFDARPVVIYPALKAAAHGAHLVMDWADWFGRGGSVEERTNPVVRALLRPVETYYEENFRTRAVATTVICSELGRKAAALGVPAQTIELIPNGCSPEKFKLISPRQARQETGLSRNIFCIGYVGSAFRKDAALMAESFDQVCTRLPEARLLVIGYFNHDLRRMVKFPERVIQTGALSETRLIQYFLSCDLFWLPLCDTNANRGRWPLKLNDYMAAGRPVVATAVGDVAHLLREHPVGVLAPDEPGQFAQQTIELANDNQLRDRIGSAGRHLAETQYHWRAFSRKLENIYQHVLCA